MKVTLEETTPGAKVEPLLRQESINGHYLEFESAKIEATKLIAKYEQLSLDKDESNLKQHTKSKLNSVHERLFNQTLEGK